jgi:hypothetical protein
MMSQIKLTALYNASDNADKPEVIIRQKFGLKYGKNSKNKKFKDLTRGKSADYSIVGRHAV